MSKPSKKSSVILGLSDNALGGAIKSALSINCDVSDAAQELIRGVRLHATKLLKGLQSDDLTKAQLGLGHSYSRAKLKFNVNRIDNMIIQAIALLDQLDKDVNLFSMRIREWYGYHFPELVRFVPDNHQYARVAQYIGDKNALDEDKLPDLAEILDDDMTLARNILDAARGSMGSSLSEIDMLNISSFATRVVSISEYRKSLISYLSEKMNLVAPSLTALLGERIGARLISHAGSLTNLSKYPASTVQILGAEKALFRALKTKGNTPKVILFFFTRYWHNLSHHLIPSTVLFTIRHSSVALGQNIKVASHGSLRTSVRWRRGLTATLVCVLLPPPLGLSCANQPETSDNPTSKFGLALRAQVEERLNFFETGAPPSKNADAIRKVLEDLALEDKDEDEDEEMEEAEPMLTTLEPSPSQEKEKKKKKRKSDAMDIDDEEDGEAVSSKKVKLSKEEKKALKKAKKEARKQENLAPADVRLIAALTSCKT